MMASFRVPVITSRLRGSVCPIRLQRRWARVHDVRFVTTRQDSHRLLDKYKEKLDKKAKE
jgi:ATP synthase mitochondrial F1 complex assembly factor 1